jgi:UDP-glucose 4-epimerase
VPATDEPHAMRRCVLITGGEGFIGANLARRLADDGDDVHILSRANPARKWKLLDLFGVEARVHTVDLLDRAGVATLLAAVRPQRVFHLAGRVDLERSSATARLCVEENIMATVSLLDALHGTEVESVVYTSTTEVYGFGPIPFREDQPVDPPSPYSVSKVAAESFCRLWARTFGRPLRILRVAAAYGPGQPAARLIPFVIGAALRGEPLTLHSGTHRRDYLFVGDVVDGIMRCAARPIPAGEIINLGSPEAIAIADIARAVLDAMGMGHLPIAAGPGRPLESPCWATDAGKARAVLDWTPTVPLDEGLRRTVAWYRALAGTG